MSLEPQATAKSLLARAWHDLADGTSDNPPFLIPCDDILRYCCYIADETHYSARFKEQVLPSIAHELQLPPPPPLPAGKAPHPLPASGLARDAPLPVEFGKRYPSAAAPLEARAPELQFPISRSAGLAPPALQRRFDWFLSSASRTNSLQARSRPVNITKIERAHKQRRKTLAQKVGPGRMYERSSWRAPNKHDMLYGKVSSVHGVEQAMRPVPFGEVDVILLTTFPVGGGGSSILGHEKSRSGCTSFSTHLTQL